MRLAPMLMTAGLSALAMMAAAPSAIAQASPGNSASTSPGESLSSKLSKSGGVIKPEASVDPGIKVPAPDPSPNTMPVIPPSATGGNSAK